MSTNITNEVFLIEDDLDIREAVVEILNYEGIQVRCFSNGREGINQLKSDQKPPCLILLDLMMPVMDGHEFLSEKNVDTRLQSIPVVVMTADAFVLQNPKRLASVAGLVKKPIDIDRLIEVVRGYVESAASSSDLNT